MKQVLLLTAAASLLSSMGGTVILDFETEQERQSAPKIAGKGYSVGVTNAFASSGSHAIRFACCKWEKGMPEWPSFNLLPKCTDWSGYDRLVVDVVSMGDGGDLLSTFIAGPSGRIQNGLHLSTRVPSCGATQWVIPLKDWPETASPTNIARVHFFTQRPEGFEIAIDRLTLLKKGEKPAPPDGPCLARDVLPAVAADRERLKMKVADLEACREHMRDYMRFRDACSAPGALRSDKMLLGVATSMEKVMPRGRFSARAMPAEGVAVRLARNELESVQVLVAPKDDDLADVKVSVDGAGLKGPGGEVFPAGCVACDVMGYVKTVRRPPYLVGYNVATNAQPGYARQTRAPETGWWPDPILDFLGGVEVKDQDVQSFWVRVRCPSAQKAGVYRGSLVVSARGVESARIPFSVRVNDFTLGRVSALPLAITFSPAPNTQHEPEENLKAAAALRADPDAPVNAWRRHEAEWTSFLADYLIPMDSLYHGNEMWRFGPLKQLKKEGRTGWFNLGYWSYPGKDETMEAWRARTIPRLRKFYDEAKANGILDHAYVYGCDEIAKEYFPAIRKAVGELKAALPGVPVSTTAYDHEFGVGTPLDVMDWFTPLTPKFDPEKAAASRKAGHKVCWYICCGPRAPHANMFVECPAIEGRLLMGAQTVRMRPDGFLYYQISIWNSRKCISSGPFTDWDPRSWTTYHGDGSWTCVGPGGVPLPTIRLENFRDGLEDFAYAKLLDEKLSAAGAAGGEWGRRARELLAVPRDVMDSMTNYTDDPSAVYAWRDAMADLIESAPLAH
jgi:hypothetical protein